MELRTSAFELPDGHVDGTIRSRVPAQFLNDARVGGQSLVEMTRKNSLSPVEVAGALALIGLSVNVGLGPALQTQKPALPEWEKWLNQNQWIQLFPEAKETAILNLIAGLNQIFDFWETSHSAAQRADDLGEHRLSAQWHAICHRREPDAFNSNYWWNRVGKNPIAGMLTELIEKSMPLLDQSTQRLASSLIERGVYSDKKMVSASNGVYSGSLEEKFLRKLQKHELIFAFDVTIEQLL